MIRAAAAAALLLGGCAQAYTPQLIEPPADLAQYSADVAKCQAAAAAYHPGLDLGSVGYKSFSGAADNAAGGTVGGPLVVVVGAAGGASQALSDGLDVMGQARVNVAKHCIQELTRRDHSAIVADPD